jgi:hypothetical protein
MLALIELTAFSSHKKPLRQGFQFMPTKLETTGHSLHGIETLRNFIFQLNGGWK